MASICLAILKIRNGRWRPIDIMWRMHLPLGVLMSVGFAHHDAIAAIRRMQVEAAPSPDRIPIKVPRKYMLIVLS